MEEVLYEVVTKVIGDAMKWVMLLFILVALLPTSAAAAQPGGSGRLIVIVRDDGGRPLAHVRLALIRDGDDGRVPIGERTTDGAGAVVFEALPWGLYIVQFRGSAPDGRPILEPTRQNLGLLDDGQGAGGGFGVRLASTERRELFVLGTVQGERAAVPMFDLAPGPEAPPRPVDPLLELQKPTPTPFTLAQALQGAPGAAQGGTNDRTLWTLCSGLLFVVVVVSAIGIWRSRGVRTRQKEKTDG
jgi:hypothetical protein